MPPRDASAHAARTVSAKRGLHPLAILFPFSSYSRPPRLGRVIRVPRWFRLWILFVAILIVDYFSVGVTVQGDGSVMYQNSNFTWETWSVVFIALATVAALLVARWWTFRWWIADDAIWTSGGILNTWRRRVAISQVVTIDRSSTPLGRAFGVSRIALETTAVDQAAPDVLLGYLSREHADQLENLLIARLVFAGEESEPRRFETLSIDRLGWRDLLLAGATTLHLRHAVAILFAVILFFQDQVAPTLVIGVDTAAFRLPSARSAIVAFVAIVAVLWLVSTLHFVAAFARFRLGRHEGWLVLETGVVRRSRRLIRAGAIQGLEIARSPLQRSFRAKRAMLRMRLPAYGSPPPYAMVLHPAVADAALPALTGQIAGMDPATSEAMCGAGVHPLAAGCRGAYVVRGPLRIAAASGAALTLLLVLEPRVWWWALLPLILAAPLALLGWLAWKGAGWYAGDGDWLLLQRGAFTRTSTAARIDQIRYIRWSQGLFSRADAPLSLAISVATSGRAGLPSQILPALVRPADPSLVRLRAVSTTDAEKIATSSGFARSLPPN